MFGRWEVGKSIQPPGYVAKFIGRLQKGAGEPAPFCINKRTYVKSGFPMI